MAQNKSRWFGRAERNVLLVGAAACLATAALCEAYPMETPTTELDAITQATTWNQDSQDSQESGRLEREILSGDTLYTGLKEIQHETYPVGE